MFLVSSKLVGDLNTTDKLKEMFKNYNLVTLKLMFI